MGRTSGRRVEVSEQELTPRGHVMLDLDSESSSELPGSLVGGGGGGGRGWRWRGVCALCHVMI